jgi:hypothetical protein
MIMIPLLILQILLFPLTAGWMMNMWVDSRRTLALQESASYMGSSIRQLYSSVSHVTIAPGTVKNTLGLPQFIEGYAYRANGSLRTTPDPALSSSKILDLTLNFMGTSIETTTTVTLGQNVLWSDSIFVSNSTGASIAAEKMSNGTIVMFFTS